MFLILIRFSKLPLKRRRHSARLSSLTNEGENQQPNDLEPSIKLKSRCARKNSPAFSTDCRAPNLRFSQRGSTLEYLIGQQRQQSMPHCAAKSSANSKLMNGEYCLIRWASGEEPLSPARSSRATACTTWQRLASACTACRAGCGTIGRRRRSFCGSGNTLFPPDHDRTGDGN